VFSVFDPVQPQRKGELKMMNEDIIKGGAYTRTSKKKGKKKAGAKKAGAKKAAPKKAAKKKAAKKR
jgi:hypothetical protein